jgi:hypothetical protein
MGFLLLCKAKPKFDFHKRKCGLNPGYLRNDPKAISGITMVNICFTLFYSNLTALKTTKKSDYRQGRFGIPCKYFATKEVECEKGRTIG